MATSLAGALQRVPFEDILSYSLLVPEYKPELCRQLIDRLTPSNMLYEVVAKANLNNPKPMTKEPIYGTDIRVEPIPEENIQRFAAAMNNRNPKLHLPKKNDYIPTNFNLKPKDPEAMYVILC